MKTNTNVIKQFFRLICYGWLLDYHLSKRKAASSNSYTVLRYHSEKAQYYYEKIYGGKPN